jgi:hypothetical protein
LQAPIKFTQIGIFGFKNVPFGNPACNTTKSFLKQNICFYIEEQHCTLPPTTHSAIIANASAVGLAPDQGCQMVYFQTKNTSLGKFWRALQWKMLVYFMAILCMLQSCDIFYGH